MTVLCNVILFRMCLLILYNHGRIRRYMHAKVIHEASTLGVLSLLGILFLLVLQFYLQLIANDLYATVKVNYEI